MARALGSPQLSSIGSTSSFRLNSAGTHVGDKLFLTKLQPLTCRRLRHLAVKVVAQAGKDDMSEELSRATLLLALGGLTTYASPARAVSKEDITNALLKIQDVSERVTGAVGDAYVVSKAFIEQLFTTVKPAVDAAKPYVQNATDAAVQVAAPIASDVATKVEKALQGAGVDTKPVVDAAKSAVIAAGEAAEQTSKVIEGAKPIASDTFNSVAGADPLFLAGGVGALILVYFLAPSILSSVAYAARGYKGNVSAAQALDLLSKADYVLIDIRREKEKSKSGVPSLPRNARSKSLSIPLEELPGKLRNQLRNIRKVEADIVAVKISYLKRIGRGSNLVILDTFGDIGKIVAKSLTTLGFKSTWVVVDGFEGRRGWLQSRLGSESYNLGKAEILFPSRIIPAGTKKLFGTTTLSEVVDVTPRLNRLLPGGFDK